MSLAAAIDVTDLVDRLKQKSCPAFGDLYDRYAPALYGIICKIVKDKAIAEDLLQETFVKVWKNIEHFDEKKGTFFTWLLNITRYTAIDHLRSRQYKQQLKNQTIPDNEYIVDSGYVAPAAEYHGLNGVVARLEPKYREVIELVYIMGHTQDEVSRLLDIPLGTVKTRTRMALQLIRKQLEHGA